MRHWSTVLLLILLGALTFAVAGAQRPDWQDKVAPTVLRQLITQSETEFIVFLQEQADLNAAGAQKDKEAKGRAVFQQLQSTARRTQAPLLAQLQREGADYRAYWIANMIWVRGDRRLLQTLASRQEVAAVYNNTYRAVDLPVPQEEPQSLAPAVVELNVAHINAPAVWALGDTGEGVVIGGQDTGYDWQHPALRAQYRGWDGTSADHNYNWHDAIHSGGGSCGADSSEPCDAYGHGTHTMGTMVGDDGAANQIGVAPGATWIGCRNMNESGVGSPATYTECFQWFLAPTDGAGNNPDPALAPHVINNSWACTGPEGCDEGEIAIMETVVETVRAAGIVVVASAGNRGYFGCGTVQYPPAVYDASLSIGATDLSDMIAPFSSRGPVTVDGSNRLKPDVVAPGVGIRSSTVGGGYGSSRGTSMAAPHVAGLVALLISADPDLAGDVDAIETAILSSAVPLTTDETCGGVPGDAIPNNTFGYGRIDALEAYLQVAPLMFRRHFPFVIQDSIQE